MTDDELSAGSDEQVEAALIRDREAAPDAAGRQAVVDDYARRYPELANRLRSLAALQERVQEALPSDTPRPPHRLSPGKRLGDFEIVRLIGVGGMGEVYEARQARLDRSVAVKVIHRGPISPEKRARFEREQKTLGRLHQTHIVPIHAAGEEGDIQYFAMAYIPGAALSRVVDSAYVQATSSTGSTPSLAELAAAEEGQRRSANEPEEAAPSRPATHPVRDPRTRVRLSMKYFRSVADVVAQAAEAVQHAHDAGVCHRDIKPSNLMVDRDGHCWIIDFGLAGHLAGGGQESSPAPDLHTRMAIGTPEYMAPEQYDGKPGLASDVWGLGATLYELLTLRRAFGGPTWKAVETQVRAADPQPLHQLVPTVSQDLAAICRCALRAAPDDRYANPGELAADLRRWLRHEPTRARGAWPLRWALLWARRNPGWAMGIVLGFLLLFGTIAWGNERSEQRRKQAEREQKRIEAELEQSERQRRFEQVLRESQDALRRFPPHAGWTQVASDKLREAVRLRPDGNLRDDAAATLAGLDATLVYLYPVPMPSARGDHWGVAGVVFSPDGTRLLAGAWWQRPEHLSPALLWDGNAANKPTAAARPGHGPVAFPDADSPLQLMLPDREAESLTLWNVGTDTALARIALPRPGWVPYAVLSADARFAATAFFPQQEDGKKAPEPGALLWAIDRRPPGTARTVAEWRGAPSALAFSPGAKLLAAGNHDGDVIVRSTADGKEVFRFTEGERRIESLGFGRNYRRPSGVRALPAGPADGWLLAVGSKGGGLSVWDLRTRNRVNSFYGSAYDVFAVAFSPDGATLASAGRYFPFLWDVSTGRPVLRVQGRQTGFPFWTEGVAFSPDGRQLVFGSASIPTFSPGGLNRFRLDDDRGIRTYRGLTGVVEKVWLSPSGKWVAALAQNWQLGVWDRKTGDVRFVWDVPAGFTADNSAVAFDEDDSQVLFASGERALRWQLETGERTGLWEMPLGLNDSLACRPGMKPLLVRRDRADGVIRARVLGPDGQKTEIYKITKLRVNDTTLSADGGVLLVNRDRGNVRPRAQLYHGLTGQPIPLDSAVLPPNFEYGQLTDTGATLALQEPLGDGKYRTQLFRLPDLKRLGTHPDLLSGTDDAGKFALMALPEDLGFALYQVGEERPVITFDVGRPRPNDNGLGISPDGRIIYWGRRDGTVCVADVDRCLEQLAPFGKP